MGVMYALRVVEQLIEGLCGDQDMTKRFADFHQLIGDRGDFAFKDLCVTLVAREAELLRGLGSCNAETQHAQRLRAVRILLAMHATLSAYAASGKAFD